MCDMWMDVDAALSEVPVNILPLTDDTDFKSREEAVAYNAAGLELIWHFTTTAGATTATVVTPTTGGAYDWAHQDGAMYTIEIPASGGASINNDTEGFGHFTGVATGVLPWRGPVIGFRAAGINNALIDGAWSATRGLGGTALPDAAADAAGGLPISDAGALDLDAQVKTAIDGLTAAVITNAAGTDVAADIIAIKGVVDTIQADTDLLDDAAGGLADIHTDLGTLTTTVGVAGAGLTAITGATLHADYNAAKTAAQAGDEMDLVDAPNGTAVAAIKTALEAVGGYLALIKAATDNLPTDPADQSLLAAALAAVALQITALGALAITVQSPVASSGTITVYQGDDYVAAEGTAIAVTVAVSGAPDLTGATVKLKLDEATWTATACTSDGTDWTITFEPDATATEALTVGAQQYELEATLVSGSVRTLARGTTIVAKDIPAV